MAPDVDEPASPPCGTGLTVIVAGGGLVRHRSVAFQAGASAAHGETPRPLLSRYREVMSRLERIASDPAICHGQPTVRGLRYPVENLLELLSSGITIDEVLDNYPDLERDDLVLQR